jgi:hypothetical protein
MASRRLTDTDLLLLDALTLRVRVADEGQLAAAGGDGTSRRLARLRERGLLQRGTIAVRRPAVESPLWTWTPGNPAPPAGRLAWRLQKRWKGISPQVVTVWWGTVQAARLMGGVGGRLRQPLQVAHDLGVADIYFQRWTAGSQDREWIGEDHYRREFRPRRGEKVADAVELDSSGEIARVIEFGGAYPARRVREFHRYWSRRQIPYEVW